MTWNNAAPALAAALVWLAGVAAQLTAVMEKIVAEGRSTPGAAQPNDVPVNWKHFMQARDPSKKSGG